MYKYLTIKCLLIFLGLISYAQKEVTKPLLINMQVYVLTTLEPLGPNPIHYISTKHVFPTNHIDSSGIASLIDSPALNKFNGYFVMTIDDIASGVRLMAKKYVNDNEKDSPEIFAQYEKYSTPSSYNILLNNRKHIQYSLITIDALWQKIMIEDFLPAHSKYQERYLNAVPAADKKTFNYYLLEKVLNAKTVVLK